MYGISVDINKFYEQTTASESEKGLQLKPRKQDADRLPRIYISQIGVAQIFNGEGLIFDRFDQAFAHIFRNNKKLFLEG